MLLFTHTHSVVLTPLDEVANEADQARPVSQQEATLEHAHALLAAWIEGLSGVDQGVDHEGTWDAMDGWTLAWQEVCTRVIVVYRAYYTVPLCMRTLVTLPMSITHHRCTCCLRRRCFPQPQQPCSSSALHVATPCLGCPRQRSLNGASCCKYVVNVVCDVAFTTCCRLLAYMHHT